MSTPDWKELQDVWRGGSPEQRGRHHRLAAWRIVALETLFAAVTVALGTVWAFRSGQHWMILWLLTIVVLFAMALALSIWSRRDVLWPSSAAPLDFLAETERRCLRRLEMLRIWTVFGAAEVVISLFLFWFAASLQRGLIAMSLVVVFGSAWLWLARKKTLQQLEGIAQLRGELDGDS